MNIGPQSALRRFRLVLHRIQAAVGDVLVEHPCHPGAHLLGIGIDTFALNPRNGPTVAIRRLRPHDSLLLEASLGQVLTAAVAESLSLLRCVDLGETNTIARIAPGDMGDSEWAEFRSARIAP